jgi:putative Ca2+/H+ antiporter (TMEM165/GDT1 family)
MDLRLFATVFATILLAELGDKTQIATMLYAADENRSKVTVFVAAALALVLASALAVLLGSAAASWASSRWTARVAGLGFVVIGIWTFARA